VACRKSFEQRVVIELSQVRPASVGFGS
jgi:hypothetical protein